MKKYITLLFVFLLLPFVALAQEDDKKENEVQVEQPTEPVVQTKVEEKKEEELEEYSQSVKRRIDKLTRKMREAERREQAAIDYAKKVQEENKNFQQFLRHFPL